MKIPKRVFTILTAILGGLAAPGAHALGAHQGIQAYQAHEQQRSAHQQLHAQAAAQVPPISNAALLNLWAHDQYAPILRNPAIQLQLYQAVVAERSQDPTRFDQEHPILGHLIRDPDYLDSVLAAQVAHPRRFAHYHHPLLPFLFGYERFISQPQPSQGVAPLTLVAPAVSTPTNAVTQGISIGMGPIAIPEPSGIVLLVLGVSVVAARSGSRRLPGGTLKQFPTESEGWPIRGDRPGSPGTPATTLLPVADRSGSPCHAQRPRKPETSSRPHRPGRPPLPGLRILANPGAIHLTGTFPQEAPERIRVESSIDLIGS